ncbi:MAG: RdgB/HAM1 family non-canonical purine NTP pyrophosphatase [Clostridia bacterium]|nr:RdgB/HAM1 family non-canonical purine NTP pyrophosphatase [Clostridia bacterium]
MDYILATHNMKKRDELHRILSPLGIKVHLAEELGIELTDAEETGETFEENAYIKAESGCRESGYPCIADDSGLSVDFLDGAPGVYSARYSGEHGNDEKNNEKLLKALEGVPFEYRGAAFISAVCCVYPDGRVVTAKGECRGRIGFEPVGEGGFGYDPLFMAEKYDYKLSTAQLTAEQKDAISHRGAALRELAAKIGE